MHLYENLLEDCGIADTRSAALAEALQQLHFAISMLDKTNRSIFAYLNPQAVSAAIEFAVIEELDVDLWGDSPTEPMYEIVFEPEFDVNKKDGDNSDTVVNMEDYR